MSYYHNSPTTKQIKQIKAARATEMKALNQQAILITRKYAKALKLVESLRDQELELDNNIKQGRYDHDQLEHVIGVLRRNRIKAHRVVQNVLKKSIDNI